MSDDSDPTDRELLADSYEAMFAIYGACEDRAALPEKLQAALAQHEPLLEKLEERVAP